MRNWSLVCFTLFTQSAIGLVWISVMGHWFGGGTRADFSIRSMSIALILTGYNVLALSFILVFAVPLFTRGAWLVFRR